MNPGWSKCGDNLCLNETYFPVTTYINNTATFGFSSTDNCCYRLCNKNYHICANNEVGCLLDEDCSTGLFCNTQLDQPRYQQFDLFVTL